MLYIQYLCTHTHTHTHTHTNTYMHLLRTKFKTTSAFSQLYTLNLEVILRYITLISYDIVNDT